jgi:outer membrane PBP1 activator LpoA protein
LCLSTPANTTAETGAQNNAAANIAPQTEAQNADPSTVAANPASTAGESLHFTLLLPLQSETLGNAASAVRSGFLAAYEQEKAGISVTILETGDTPEETVARYNDASKSSTVMIGPLTRGAAAALVQSGALRIPTIALTQPDSGEGVAPSPLMLAMGLSVEDEARQVSTWIAAGKPANAIFAVCTASPWQRRAAKAFVAQAKLQQLGADAIELGSANGYLSASDLVKFKKRVQEQKPAAVFAALDAAQAQQMRELIGSETPVYGTAQLNPLALADWQSAEPVPEMNGVHLLDIPWQLLPDHPAVMIYPRMVIAAGQKRSADLERLYALGIDAFRVAHLVAAQRKQFEIDGVTGKLKIGFNKDGTHFERVEPYAIYRDGKVVALPEGQ